MNTTLIVLAATTAILVTVLVIMVTRSKNEQKARDRLFRRR